MAESEPEPEFKYWLEINRHDSHMDYRVYDITCKPSPEDILLHNSIESVFESIVHHMCEHGVKRWSIVGTLHYGTPYLPVYIC